MSSPQNPATELSLALSRAVAAAAPSVVRVEARRRGASGFAWTDDLVLTAHHIVQREEDLRVGLADGRELAATLVGRDPRSDLAVLRVAEKVLTPLPLREPGDVGTGELTLALARPGRSIRASMRIVGLTAQEVHAPSGLLLEHYLESDRGFPPGFSGGPLVDVEGRGLGLNTPALWRGADLTLTAPTLRRVVGELLTHGSVRRGYLGVQLLTAALPTTLARELGQEHGALITGLDEDGPGQKAGLLLGDVLVEVDGRKIGDPGDLSAIVGERAGQRLTTRLVRAGRIESLDLEVGERRR